MDELYEMIEEKIAAAGYPGAVDGYEIYNEICDEIEEKEEGSYVFFSKKEDDIFYEYSIQILEEEFNLSSINIHTPNQVYHVDFDA